MANGGGADNSEDENPDGWASETVLDLRDALGGAGASWPRPASSVGEIHGGSGPSDCFFDLEHILQVVLLEEGALEDQSTLEDTWAAECPSQRQHPSAMGMTLREMRRTGTLGALNEDVQQALLGGTLYEYSDGGGVTGATAQTRASAFRSSASSTMPTLRLRDRGGSMSSAHEGATTLNLERLLQLSSRGHSGGGDILERLMDTTRSFVPPSNRGGNHGALHSASPDTRRQPQSSGRRTESRASSGMGNQEVAMEEWPEVSTARSAHSGIELRAEEGESDGEASSVGTMSETLRSGLRSVTLELSGAAGGDVDVEVTVPRIGIGGARDTGASWNGDEGHSFRTDADADDADDAASDGTISFDDNDETQSLWGRGDTARSIASSSRSIGDHSVRSGLGDTASFEAGLGSMLQRLAMDSTGFDESLARSVRRVLQLGTVLTGQRLSHDEIKALPKVRFDAADQQRCAICLEAYQKGELLTALRCSHFFHVDCLGAWFKKSTQCPLCRADVGAEGALAGGSPSSPGPE